MGYDRVTWGGAARLLAGAAAALAACRDSATQPQTGPPARIVVLAGSSQSALANTEVPEPIRLAVRDASGRGVADAEVTFTVGLGGGTLVGEPIASTDANGLVMAPRWRLGKSATAQLLRASVGEVITDIGATVASDFHIVVRFFGDPPSAEHQQVFSRALARVRGIITGDLPAVNALNSGIDLEQCGITGQPSLNEVIDDVLIFAAVQNIDGPGRILARAGPCLVRTGDMPMTAVGVMTFDASDLGLFLKGAAFEDVVTHEIIHVLGFGTLWTDHALIRDTTSQDPRYTGLQGHHGCLAAGWPLPCTVDIPVEAGGGRGTALSHWRETVFGSELLTGYYSTGGNALTMLTIGSLEDLGFVVNQAAADEPILGGVSLRGPAAMPARAREGWDESLGPVAAITPDGRVQPLPDRSLPEARRPFKQ